MTSPPKRPFSNDYLLKYSHEHVYYEFDMLLGLSDLWTRVGRISAPSDDDALRIKNALVESSVIHVRNVVDFLYIDNPGETDVVAADFYAPGAWKAERPASSSVLDRAKRRANKEIAHLSSSRMAGEPPEKLWNFPALAKDLLPIMRAMASGADNLRLSSNVLQRLSQP
jgi:hypothetical protein